VAVKTSFVSPPPLAVSTAPHPFPESTVSLGLLLFAALAVTPPDTGYVPGPDGVRLYYERIGSGRTTFIVPGRLFLARDLAPLARRYTLILYDMRNRGRSSHVEDGDLLTIQKDVEDLEAVRRHFGVERFIPIGFSYLGFMVVLYAKDYPQRVERLIQLGPVPRKFGTAYPPGLEHRDSVPVVDSAAAARIDSLARTEWGRTHQRELCRQSHEVFARRLLGRPARASGLMDPCEMENEWPANLARHFEHHFGAVQQLDVPRESVAAVRAPVLTIHGTWDRNAPYAAGREWAMTLPGARLLTVEEAAHMVTLDAPEVVIPAIAGFAEGRWPPEAERVTRLER
jgi:pimeloyl-ACP methyl ester carboxylesterase